MNNQAAICWIAAVIFATLGMSWGIVMSASGDHTLAAAHGHLNLIGWASLALYGTFYALVPKAGEGILAKIQIALAIFAVPVMVPGIALAIRHQGEGLAKAGSLLTIASMLLFLWIVVTNARRRQAA